MSARGDGSARLKAEYHGHDQAELRNTACGVNNTGKHRLTQLGAHDTTWGLPVDMIVIRQVGDDSAAKRKLKIAEMSAGVRTQRKLPCYAHIFIAANAGHRLNFDWFIATASKAESTHQAMRGLLMR